MSISFLESRRRFLLSLRAIPGGHGGPLFKRFLHASYELHRPFAGNGPAETFGAYRLHAPLHLLRRLTRPDRLHPAVTAFLVREAANRKNRPIVLIDFGCGLAQFSRHLAKVLLRHGRRVRLLLADIPTICKPFVLWTCATAGIDARFLDCTERRPIPRLPSADICIATEFFEHVHDPLRYLDALDGALRPGAFLLTTVNDHDNEFFHVHPDLGVVRARLASRGYEALMPNHLYQKRRDTKNGQLVDRDRLKKQRAE